MGKYYIIDCNSETQAGTLRQWFHENLRPDVPVTETQLCVELESNQVQGLRRDHGLVPSPVII